MARKSGTSGVTTFPTPATAEKSKVYAVTANGTPVFVEHWKDLHYAHFVFKGKCEVVVSIEPSIGHRNLKFVHKYSISPRRYGVKAAVELNTLTFTIAEPRKLIIQVNEHERLILFADAPDEKAPKPGQPGVVNVMDFVTDNAGKGMQTERIAAAVKAVPKGGTLYFPAGVYRSGTIQLKGDMTMYLAGGALVEGSTEEKDYFIDESSWHWANCALLYVPRCNNVRVAGFGTLHGNGSIVRAKQFGVHAFVAVDAKNVTLENVFLRDPSTQNTHPVNVENFTARNIKIIDNRNVLNADGVDMSSVRHGLAEDCFIYCADDAVVVKSYGEHKSSDILARRNVILTKKSALKVGTESEADMEDITFIDNEVVESDRGMTLYVEDGVTVRDVKYVNNRFEYHIPDARQRLIDFYIWDRRGGGNVVNVLVKDCEADMRWPRPSTIAGLDENNEFKGVHFENFRIEGRVAKTLAEADVVVEVYSPQDVRRPHVHDVTVDGEKWNPAILVERERPCR